MGKQSLFTKEGLKMLAVKTAAGIMAAILGLSAGTYLAPDISAGVYAASYTTLNLNDTFVTGNMTEKGQEDFYWITLPSGGWLTVQYQAGSLYGSHYTLYNEDQSTKYLSEYISGARETEPKNSSFTEVLEGGRYLLKINQHRNDYMGWYKVKASFNPAGNNETEPNDSWESAAPLKCNEEVTGLISRDDITDYYALDIVKKTTIQLSAISRIPSLHVSVWSSSFESIASNGCGAGASEGNPVTKTWDIELNPGKYYVKVEQESFTYHYGRYTLKWSEKAIPVSSIEVSGPAAARVGECLAYQAKILPDNATIKGVKWSSSNTSVATINSQGTVVPKKPGVVTIKAVASDGSGTNGSIKLTVSEAVKKVTKVTISGEKTFRAGENIKLKAAVTPKKATNKKVKWSTTNKTVAQVDKNGKVTAKKAGKTSIIATATDGSNVSGRYDIVVVKKNADPAKSKLVKQITSVKANKSGNKKVNTSWKKQSGAGKYEVQLATDKNFTKNLTKKYADKSKDSISIKYSKTGNVYVRVRAYDKYGYVGKWSNAKTIKVK